MGKGNGSLFVKSGLHDQDMVKTTQKSSSREPAGRFSRKSVCSIDDSSPS